MIAYITGTILAKNDNSLILKTSDLGYKVFVSKKVLYENQVNDSLELFTYEHIREDLRDLFGFVDLADLQLFEKLISVSGVGPKTALAIFSEASGNDIKSAIIHGDSSILKKVSGIGGKTADRIVLELKNKLEGLVGINIKSKDELTIDSDAMEALTSLGYPANQAREALKKVSPDINKLEERVREALKFLSH